MIYLKMTLKNERSSNTTPLKTGGELRCSEKHSPPKQSLLVGP
jgi:hypothetical protein